MKNKNKKIAEQILNLEKRYANGENVEAEMMKIVDTLSLEDMLAIDEYLVEKMKNF